MALPLLVRTLAEKKVAEFCKRRVPARARDMVKLSYKFRGNSVTLFEERAPWHESLKEWSRMAIAQMRYDAKTGEWTLYCADRNDRWHEYFDVLPAKKMDELLKEIDHDPTGIFWG